MASHFMCQRVLVLELRLCFDLFKKLERAGQAPLTRKKCSYKADHPPKFSLL